MHINALLMDYCASMSGNVGATCRPPPSGGDLQLRRLLIIWAPMNVKVGALRRRVAPPASTDYWALLNARVGAACHRPPVSCASGIYRLLVIDSLPLLPLIAIGASDISEIPKS